MNTHTYTHTQPPSPMSDGGEEVRGQRLHYTPKQNPYCLRLTPFDADGNQLYDFGCIVNEYLTHNDYDVWIIGEERSVKDKLHYHVYFETAATIDVVRKQVQDFVYPYYPVRKRGFGIKQYHLQESENPLNAIMYTVKHRGQRDYSGLTDDFVELCVINSFEKVLSQYEVEVVELTELFMDRKIEDPYEYAEKLCFVYAKYDKRIHWKDIQGLVNSKIIKRDPSKAPGMVRRNLTF